MATETAQYEKQMVEAARRELEQARQLFDQRIKEFEDYGKTLVNEMQYFRSSRSKWLR